MSDKKATDITTLKEPTLIGTLERIAAAIEAQTESIDVLIEETMFLQDVLKRKSEGRQ